MKLAFIVLLFCVSCTQFRVRSQQGIRVFLTPNPLYRERVQLEGKLEYYLWGLYPAKGRTLYVDKVLKKHGVASAANVSITRKRDFYDVLYSFLSFGMYTPLSYEITAFKGSEER